VFDNIRLPKDTPLRNAIRIINPLGEDTSIMRTVILPSMLDILSRNHAYKNKGVKLYEMGRIYLPVEGRDLPDEPKRLIFGTYGEHEDFFSMKGEIDALLAALNVPAATYVRSSDDPSYHPGRCAELRIGGQKVGVLGQIHPLVAETYGIGADVYCAELDFALLQTMADGERVFHPLPKFPAVTRDLALVCDEAVTVGALEACITASAGKLLRRIDLFDIYRGPGIEAGKKSVAFSLELRADDRTLTDDDSVGVVNKVLEKLESELHAKLR
jgi:phenylalanyl-tRNA synthetase beta chain